MLLLNHYLRCNSPDSHEKLTLLALLVCSAFVARAQQILVRNLTPVDYNTIAYPNITIFDTTTGKVIAVNKDNLQEHTVALQAACGLSIAASWDAMEEFVRQLNASCK